MKNILITLILFTLFGFSNKTNSNISLVEENLNGNVRFIKELVFEALEKEGEISKGKLLMGCRSFIYDKKGNLIEYMELNLDSSPSIKSSMRYNKKGKIIKQINNYYSNNQQSTIINKYSRKGDLKKSKVSNSKQKISSTIYKYDKKRNLIVENSSLYGNKSLTSSKTTYTYDDKGNLIETNSYRSEILNNKSLYVYNNEGNLIEDYYYNKDKLSNKSKYIYNEKGILSEKNTYYSDSTLCQMWNTKFDEQGNEIERNYINQECKLTIKQLFQYDKKGNQLEWNYYDAEGNPTYNGKLTYKFDTKGNLVEKIIYNNGIAKSITEREIEYY